MFAIDGEDASFGGLLREKMRSRLGVDFACRRSTYL